jgi:hypothetical protein
MLAQATGVTGSDGAEPVKGKDMLEIVTVLFER